MACGCVWQYCARRRLGANHRSHAAMESPGCHTAVVAVFSCGSLGHGNEGIQTSKVTMATLYVSANYLSRRMREPFFKVSAFRSSKNCCCCMTACHSRCSSLQTLAWDFSLVQHFFLKMPLPSLSSLWQVFEPCAHNCPTALNRWVSAGHTAPRGPWKPCRLSRLCACDPFAGHY